jgi:hypothetical protein
VQQNAFSLGTSLSFALLGSCDRCRDCPKAEHDAEGLVHTHGGAMRSRALATTWSVLALTSCDGIADPVLARGLRVENLTRDTLVVVAVGVTPLTDIFVPPVGAAGPRTVSDSAALPAYGAPNASARGLIAPGGSYTFRAADISDFGSDRALIVLTRRVRRGYSFEANPLRFEPAQLRASNARIQLRASQYFPDVLP